MITKNEQKQLKKILGSHYTKAVLKILLANDIRTKKGISHNATYIRAVFQGLRNNKEIESAIWEVASNKKRETEEFNNKKKTILK